MLVLSLELARLVPRVWLERTIQCQLESVTQLVIVHGSVETVVGVPLLGQAESVLLDLVLGLKGTSDLRESVLNLLNH